MSDVADASTESLDQAGPILFLKNKVLAWDMNLDEMLSDEAYLDLKKGDLETIAMYYKVFKNIAQFSKDAKDHDPEIYKLFLKIKEALGVTENINFRIGTAECIILENNIASYNWNFNTLTLHEDYKNLDPINLIQTIAHELEHMKQFYHYPDSYHIPSFKELIYSKKQGIQSKTGIHLKAETGADANTAGYFDCPKCLEYLANNRENPLLKHNPQNLPSGYFTTQLGYFSEKDYKDYIARACLDGELCKAHKLIEDAKQDVTIFRYLPAELFLPQANNKNAS